MSTRDRINPALLTAEGLRARRSTAFHGQPQEVGFHSGGSGVPGPSDFALNPDMWEEVDHPANLTPAAVLIPIVARAQLTVILTERTRHLSKHAGQISFPGGRIDADDEGPTAAAIREAQEEIGLQQRFVSPLGYLDTYVTRTQFAVTPVAALVEPGFQLTCNEHEVADVFEVPLSFLLDASNLDAHDVVLNGKRRRFYAFNYGERFIWGATAGMIKNFHERLFGE